MGALMRATDWSQTPVGPVEHWPQSLRTVLSILLASRHPMFVWWGRELVQFYNDGYRPILGSTKHPRALGQRGRECWTEIWDVIEPMIASVMERGEATFIEDGLLCLDRNGYVEEAYFTYAYSPIRDESGGVGGIFVACTEVTERVLGERRLKTLRELSESISRQRGTEDICHEAARVLATNRHDVPFALLYLADEQGSTARLVSTVGVEPGSAAAPLLLQREDPQTPWPWTPAAGDGKAVLLKTLPATLGALPGGPWPEAASSALVLSLDWPGHDEPTGMLVVGLSPRQTLDTAYRGFLALAASHIASAMANVRVTSRTQMEIARAHAESRNARARLHAQLMQAPVAMSIVTGPDFVYELANPHYLAMVGRQDVVGQPLRAVFPELPADAPVFQMLQQVYTTGQTFMAEAFPVPLVRKDTGTVEDVYFQFTCQPMLDVHGTIEGIMTVAVDVTVLVRARHQMEQLAEREREARGRAEEADKRKDEFLAMLAHELRNPLAALSTALELMGRVQGDAARMARLRDTSLRQVGNLVRMVDDLLDVSRITRGKVELRKREVDLTTIVQNAIGTSRIHLDARNHELSVTLLPGSFRLEADATRLEQVVSNLLTNAARYTEPGGHVSVRLSRESSAEGPQAILRVRDTGRGISKEMLDKVFDMFVQVDTSLDRSGGGLGIGLTLVKKLVAMHGGSVSAHSEGLGKGSEFVVRLPLPSQERPEATPPESSAPGPAAPRKRRVLVVEDSEDVREMMRELLEDLGHEVEVATNGLEGVEKVLRLRPDVALVDMGLPGIDGYELARRVRAAAGGDSLYLVALTGYGGPDARKMAREAGFDLHLVKPVDMDELPRVLASSRRPPNERPGPTGHE